MFFTNELSSPEACENYVNKIQSTNPSHYAFVVNIPLAATAESVKQIKAVCDAYHQDDLPTPPFAMVFCINGNNDINAYIRKNKKSLAKLVAAEQRFPMGIMFYQWSGESFPYGHVRNQIMHGKLTGFYVNQFTQQALVPYLAIADSDAGERFVITSTGRIHIFQAVQESLTESRSTEDRELMLSLDIVDDMPDQVYTRPYIIGGGYRVSSSIQSPARHRVIEDDMLARSQLTRLVNPLGAYHPEPNLFLDALFVLNHQILFGEGSEEFKKLRENMLIAMQQEQVEVEGWLNNRHESRGHLVHSDFQNLTVATDTERLFKGASMHASTNTEYNHNTVSQHHRGSNLAKTSYLASRYNGKENGGDCFMLLRNIINAVIKKNTPNRAVAMLVELELIIYALARGMDLNRVDKSLFESDIASLFKKLTTAQKNALRLQKNRTASPFVYAPYSIIDVWHTALITVNHQINGGLIEAMQSSKREFFSKEEPATVMTDPLTGKLTMVRPAENPENARKNAILKALGFIHDGHDVLPQQYTPTQELLDEERALTERYVEGRSVANVVEEVAHELFEHYGLELRRMYRDYYAWEADYSGVDEYPEKSSGEILHLNECYQKFEIEVISKLLIDGDLSKLSSTQQNMLQEEIHLAFIEVVTSTQYEGEVTDYVQQQPTVQAVVLGLAEEFFNNTQLLESFQNYYAGNGSGFNVLKEAYLEFEQAVLRRLLSGEGQPPLSTQELKAEIRVEFDRVVLSTLPASNSSLEHSERQAKREDEGSGSQFGFGFHR